MTLKIGWIGCGRHARQMLLPRLPDHGIRLAALCDSDRTALATTAEAYGVDDCYGDFRDLLRHPGLDAIGMAVGPELHRAAAIAALERGLPVFMEKPPAATAAGAREVAAAAQKAGKPVIVGFMKRYSSGNRIAMNLLRNEGFGSILGITGSYLTAPTYFEGEPDYTGFFLHHCVHYMDLVPWFASSEFDELSVRKVSPAPGRLLLHLGFTTEAGAIGNIVMGTVQSRGTPMEEIRIMGDHKRIEVDNIVNVELHRDPPFKADNPAATLDDTVDTLTWQPNFTAAANEDHKGYSGLLAEAAAVLKGESRNAPTIEDGVLAMERLERMIGALDM